MTRHKAQRIRRALANHRLPARTNGGRIRDALQHVRRSKKVTPGGRPGVSVPMSGRDVGTEHRHGRF